MVLTRSVPGRMHDPERFSGHDSLTIIWGGLLAGLFGFDIAFTDLILAHGGSELNPFMMPVVWNIWFHLIVKASALFLIYLLARKIDQMTKSTGVFLMTGIAAWYIMVNLNNFVVLMGLLTAV